MGSSPSALPTPSPPRSPAIPAGWARPYAVMAAEVDLDADPAEGRADAEAFLAPVWSAEDPAQRWDPGQRRRVGGLRAGRRRGARAARAPRHPRQQRGDHQRPPDAQDDGRRLEQGHLGQPVGRVLHVASRARAHARARVGAGSSTSHRSAARPAISGRPTTRPRSPACSA